MTITSTVSNHFKYQRDIGNVDMSSDTIVAIFMKPGFIFDKDADATLADVTADQIATGNGYTQNSHALQNQAVAEDDTNDRSSTTADDLTITASGGQIEEFGSVCFYDDTTSDDTVIGCTDFGFSDTVHDSVSDGSVTADGSTFTSSGSSWTVNELANMGLTIASGDNAGTYVIVSNTATVITISGTFPATESSISASIYEDVTYTITDGTSFQLKTIRFDSN